MNRFRINYIDCGIEGPDECAHGDLEHERQSQEGGFLDSCASGLLGKGAVERDQSQELRWV
jgi:hypothetical protein